MVIATSYDVDQDKRFKKYLSDATRSMKDLSFSMGEAARIVKKGQTGNFILKGPGQYEPLSVDYQIRKKILSPGTPIMVGAKKGSVVGGRLVSGGGVSGKLRDSILGQTSDSVTRIGKLSAVVGTKARSKDGKPYPVFVQGGTKNMEPRKMLFLTKQIVDQIVKTITAETVQKWKNP